MRGGSSSGSDSRRGLMRDDALGITFEHCGADEAEFLYEEIFTRRAYLQGGVQFPLTNTPSEPAVVVDVGANIGLFSLHCLALAWPLRLRSSAANAVGDGSTAMMVARGARERQWSEKTPMLAPASTTTAGSDGGLVSGNCTPPCR